MNLSLSTELLLDFLDDIVFVADKTNTVVFANKNARKVYSYSISSISTNQLQICLPTDLKESLVRVRKEYESAKNTDFNILSNRIQYSVCCTTLNQEEGEFFVYVLKNKTKHENVLFDLHESENLFRSVFENAPGGILMMSPDTKIMAANKYLRSLLGYSIEDLIETPYFELIVNPDDVEYQQKLEDLVNGKKTAFESEKRLNHKNKNQITVLSTTSIIRSSDGKPLYILEQLINITKRKLAEKALRLSELKFINFFNASPILYVILSKETNRVIDCNKTFNEATSFTKEEVLGKHISELFATKDRNIINAMLATLDEHGIIQDVETLILSKIDKSIPVSLSAIPIVDNSSCTVSYIFACTNITYQLKIRDELILAKDKAEQSDNLKASFLSNLSHEIRTPMNGIVGFSDLIAAQPGINDKVLKYTNIIKERSNVLLQVINDLIDISKIASGSLLLNDSLFSLKDMMVDVEGTTINKLMMANKSDIKFVILDQLFDNTVFVNSDRVRIQQILDILIDNAIKFTQKGSIKIGGRITSQDELIIWVSDSGIGIPRDKTSIIFERFRQVDERLARRYEGNGLGLAIAQGLATLLNGKIWVESVVDRGSIFYFKTPLNLSNTASAPLHIIPEVIEEKPVYEDKVILLVEDDPISAELITELLHGTGISIILVKDGKTAKAAIDKKNNISLVLMDIRLPDGNGIDITKYIKSKKNIPIIAQTAFALEEEKRKFITDGCDDYIAKPIDKATLMKKINSLL